MGAKATLLDHAEGLEGDIYVSWSDSDGKYYLTKNNKVLYTASENMFYNFCVIE